MISRFSIWLLLSCFSLSLHSESLETLSTSSLLSTLDQVVAQKERYRKRFEQQQNALRHQARKSHVQGKSEAYAQLFQRYVHHQSDSALAYLDMMELHPRFQSDADYAARVRIGRAETYGVMGLYNAANEALIHIDAKYLQPSTRLYYYQVCRTVYGWMSDFGEIANQQQDFLALTHAYRDSILAIQPEGIDRKIVQVDKLMVEGKPLLAYNLCQQALKQADEKQRTFLYILLADATKVLGRNEESIRFLALAALNDIQRGITEYTSLPRLALALSEQGDVVRAYDYLLCTMDDANFCKARLRSFEASSIFPIIERAHKAKVRERQYVAIVIAILVGLVLLMLVGFIFLMRRQMHKLRIARQELAEALTSIREVNAALVKANAELHTTDKVKETYIARYLQRCRGYIDTLDDFRRQLLKLAKSKKYEELGARLQGNEFLQEEERAFFLEFDEAFVTLFPTFIDNFNALLLPEARTYPKRDEILNTELRVFALVRLGVTDSNRIAHFLNYSLPTIYSYRSRLRNKSICEKGTFDEAVMKC